MRDLTKEELKWVSKEQIENWIFECIPNSIDEEDIEERIALEVEQGKKAEEDNQREKAILAKPENERTHEEKQFIFRRKMINKAIESQMRSFNDYLNRGSLLSGLDQAKPDTESKRTIKFRRPVPYKVD